MTTPKISIIMPVYNTAKYLREALNSIINQTFKDFEIICINDGSTDFSLEILKEYELSDTRFRIVTCPKRGAGHARNVGVKFAKGKYIQFLDSDDYFSPSMLEELFTQAEKYSSEITVCSSHKVNDSGEIIETKNPNSPINLALTPLYKPFNRTDFPESIFSLLTPVPWNKLFLKQLITNNNILFPEINICEDIAFVHACIACAKKIVVFDKELISYRYNRSGSMATYRTRYVADVITSCLHLKEFLEGKGLYDELKGAFITAFKNHIRWEIAQCNDEEYAKFLQEFKARMNNDWMQYKSALRKEYITLEFLKKVIGNKKVVLWGASFFIQKLLSQEKEANPNILGIIDKNEALWGKMCGKYKIFSPNELNDLNPDGIIMTVWSNYESAYEILKQELDKNYPQFKLLPNIFEEDLY